LNRLAGGLRKKVLMEDEILKELRKINAQLDAIKGSLGIITFAVGIVMLVAIWFLSAQLGALARGWL
jgi:hypothetical protein